MPSATRRMPSWTLARVFSLTARMVPSMCAVSGMMLFVVPAAILPTVTTAGSNTSTERVTMICSACTISHATGIGSIVRCGSLAWPPLPVIVISSRSADAMIDPPPAAQPPRRQRRGDVEGERPGDGRRRAVGEVGHVEQPLVEHVAGAVVALLAGLEHEQHAPGEVVAAAGEQLGGAGEHRRVGVVTAGVHRPVVAGGEVEPGVLVQRQGIHVAAQQDRRPRTVAGQQGGDAARRLVDGHVDGQPFQRAEHDLLRARAARCRPPASGAARAAARRSGVSRSFASSRREAVSTGMGSW